MQFLFYFAYLSCIVCVIMIPKEKQATVLQAFPFQACFNEQIFLRSRKKSSVRAYLRVCRRPKRKASDTTLDTKEEDVYEKNAV